MVKDYSVSPQMAENKNGPSQAALQFILNYSKSVEAKKTKQDQVLVHLN